ncbi:MAG: beta-ketoacyl synthase N-terminal-like domain-containing protein [Kiritimatiellia bacterium]|nr:beta-ketoacyl synthase N-terminal-like domain-containing protein [Kiritimatiellia bacterium]
MKRVVITGAGAVGPLGGNVPDMVRALDKGVSAVVAMPGWTEYKGLRSWVAAPAVPVNEKSIPRQNRRTMGRLAIYTVIAAEEAVRDADLRRENWSNGRTACVVGSTMGSAGSLHESFEMMYPDKNLANLTSVKFFQCVSHTAALNLSQYLNIQGVVQATSAARASGLQAIGAGFDLIRTGRQDLALCGGAEELHPTVTGSFDVLYATSVRYNETPQQTPRPFDRDRDGLVCGEGAGIVVLEEYERAVARGARIYGEILGYQTCGSGDHVSQSNAGAMARCMRGALSESGLPPEEIDYISAHATATVQGDVEEALAIAEVFGDRPPVSSLKGHMGHTLGASGAIELILSLQMMEQGVIYPTLNLKTIDPACAGIRHVQTIERQPLRTLLKNSFAFGGINAALVFRKAEK